jgi:hypothetical protein
MPAINPVDSVTEVVAEEADAIFVEDDGATVGPNEGGFTTLAALVDTTLAVTDESDVDPNIVAAC